MGFLSSNLLNVVMLACLVTAGWALIDCVTRKPQAFPVAGKLTKPAWLGINAAAVALIWLFGPLSIFGIAAIVAAIVYLVDVRPAVREVQGPGRW